MCKRRYISQVLCTLIFLLSVTGLCFGDWDIGDGHKMHYPQLPDLEPTGMDVLAGPLNVQEGLPPYEKFLADDFRCSQDGPITSIHIWGSYNQDRALHEMTQTAYFSLVIYSDIPAEQSPTGYSMPGVPLWQTYMRPTAIRLYANGLQESFYDPNPNEIIGQDTICWQYNFEISSDKAFIQEAGTIYWLGIHYSFDLDGDGIINISDLFLFKESWPGMFGWKTSGVEHFNDDAVFTDVMTWGGDPHVVPVPDPLANPWQEMRYPVGHEKETQSIDLAFVINGEGDPDEFDFGDAPDSYGTKLPTGAYHIIGGPWLGANAPDSEADGQPTLLADGDDLDMAVNDEDGIVFTLPFIQGQPSAITITVSGGGGSIAGWFDWDQSGTFDAGEQEIALSLPDGVHPLVINPPNNSVPGQTYARFRITSSSSIPSSPTGQLSDGEVEDYIIDVEEAPEILDFGDAPDSYGTTLSNTGANHVIVGPWLGVNVPDPEADGQPTLLADGDDLDMAVNDEDGVQIPPVLTAGIANAITVTVNDLAIPGGGVVQIWIDWDQNGVFDDPAESVHNAFLTTGIHQVPVTPPADSVGSSYLRARISSQGGLPPDGTAIDGEVEDYTVIIEEPPYLIKWAQLPDPDLSGLHAHDYGDAGGTNYQQIIIADDWKCGGGVVTDFHWWGFVEEFGEGLGGFHLSIHANDPTGSCLPLDPALWEKDVPISDITVTQVGSLYRYDYYLEPEDYFYQIAGETYWFDLSALSVDPSTACLWIWAQHARGPAPTLCGAVDKIIPTRPLWKPITWGTDPLIYTDMAFRVTSNPDIPLIDFGDAPDFAGALGYPTLLIHNGARHTIGGPYLGDISDVPDPEGNGQPAPMADGDDNDGNDDEDGVNIPIMKQGITTTITLEVNGGGGMVDAWIDWNQDQIWQSSEQIHNTFLPDGIHSFNVTPPQTAMTGTTYARFRISSIGSLPPDGPADDGEVEDYIVSIEEGPQADLGDAPDSTNSHGVAMIAYPDGTPANYPTVAVAGSPPFGPKHNASTSSAWLGQIVTLEDEADIGLDQDGINNIDPPSDTADLDIADDSLQFPVQMPKCKWTNVNYDVTAPSATGIYYVNIWCDFNRDGDWNDQVNGCSMGDIPEWAVRNQLLTGLVPGLNTITSLPFVSWHPIDRPEELWVRITLSEQPWQETWGPGGCGPVFGFGYSIGETEDYYITPITSCTGCPDLNCDGVVDLLDFQIIAASWLN